MTEFTRKSVKGQRKNVFKSQCSLEHPAQDLFYRKEQTILFIFQKIVSKDTQYRFLCLHKIKKRRRKHITA